jgi:hypothetical protein
MIAAARVRPSQSHRLDLSIAGLLPVRVTASTHQDAQAIARRIGGLPSDQPPNPDVVVSVDRIPRPERFVAGRSGLTRENGLVLAGRTGATLVADPYLRSSPVSVTVPDVDADLAVLREVLRVRAAQLGIVGIHGSAFALAGSGTLLAGWAGSGKTGVLMAALRDGARFLADDDVWIAQDPPRLLSGGRERIEVRVWHADAFPEVLGRASAPDRLRARGAGAILRAAAGLKHLRRRLAVRPILHVTPERLAGIERMTDSAELDRVILLVGSGASAVSVRSITTTEAANRIAAMQDAERAQLVLMSQLLAFRGRDLGYDGAAVDRRTREILLTALASVPCYEIEHPAPPSGAVIWEAVRSCSP